MTASLKLSVDNIGTKIHTIRGNQVILDEDLAELYDVDTRVLNQAVKRNTERFPLHFMFRITDQEYNLISQFVTSSSWGGRRKLPFVFTEQGVAMLSGVLKSDTAIIISIQIINAFVAMRRFIASNADVFQRLDRVELKQVEHDANFDQLFDAIQSKFLPEKGIFFDGQMFDAYKFVSDIVRTAESSIILIDNYIDDSVLTILNKRKTNVKAVIFTKEISKQLSLDLAKYNSQYPLIEVREFRQSHDRFLIVDNKEVYHFGASLKDLGKKWFAFSKFDKDALKILSKLEQHKLSG